MKDYSIDPELIERVKNGQDEYFPVLWNKVKGYVYQKATAALKANNGIERDDLEQAGRIALWKTVQSFDPQKGAFFHLFKMTLKTEFATVCGYRTRKQKNDAFRLAVSLDEPIKDTEGECTLQDIIPDRESEAPFEEIERRIWNIELHETLERSMKVLPDRNISIIKQHYYECRSVSDIAGAMNLNASTVRQIEYNSFSKLQQKKELQQFVDRHTPSLSKHVCIRTFNQTHTSAVEWLVMKREDLALWFNRMDEDVKG